MTLARESGVPHIKFEASANTRLRSRFKAQVLARENSRLGSLLGESATSNQKYEDQLPCQSHLTNYSSVLRQHSSAIRLSACLSVSTKGPNEEPRGTPDQGGVMNVPVQATKTRKKNRKLYSASRNNRPPLGFWGGDGPALSAGSWGGMGILSAVVGLEGGDGQANDG